MKSLLENQVAIGKVMHQRLGPVPHKFKYKLYMSLVNLDAISSEIKKKRLFGPHLKVSDYYQNWEGKQVVDELMLKAAIAKEVRSQLGLVVNGRITMLTHLRQFSCCFNPVTFYFCFDQNDRMLAIVAEINNTPWDERCYYVLDARDLGHNGELNFHFNKSFHVSPFLPMDINYHWLFRFKKNVLSVSMNLYRGKQKVFLTAMNLKLKKMTSQSLRSAVLRYPFLCQRILLRIYWHALLLLIKKVKFYPHPKTNST